MTDTDYPQGSGLTTDQIAAAGTRTGQENTTHPADREGYRDDNAQLADREGYRDDIAEPADREGYRDDNAQLADREGYRDDNAQPADREGYRDDIPEPAGREGYRDDIPQPADREGFEPGYAADDALHAEGPAASGRAGRRAADAGEGNGASGSMQRASLLADDELQSITMRWKDIQAEFVDEPEQAVQEADALVAELMQRLASMFATERAELEQRWAGGQEVNTEDLRQGLRRYRSFFERLLAA